MKRLLTLSTFLLLSFMTFARTKVNGIYYNFSGTEATVVEGFGYTGSVTIPASVTYDGKKYSVTSIGWKAFSGCGTLTSVTIPNSVTSIGSHAFFRCSRLKSVNIPNSVTSIGELAFYECSGLTSITIPNSVTNIKKNAFEGCSGLKKVIVSDITKWYSIFWGSTSANPLTYAHHLYSDENTEIKELIIPNSVTSIGNYAFDGCSGLTSITIPNSVTSIGERAFYGCSGLTSITIPNSVTSIGERAFYGCSGLTSIDIPNSVTSIGYRVFSGCSGLTSITIPNSVTSIGDQAFWGCSGLTSVTIPNSVTSIGEWAFYYCSGLTSITIPNSVTSIEGEAFSGCKGLTSITIPNSVTSIGNYAFDGCSGLTSITIPNSVTSIGEGAFSGCSGLTSITIPNSVTSIEYHAFSGCSGLTSVCSYIEEPASVIGSNFDNSNYSNSTLYVPFGTKDKYLATDGWKKFANIVEMPQEIEPIEEETVIAFNDKDYIVDNTPVDLNNTVINDMYISMDNKSDVNNHDGFYDSTEKCIVINKATSASAIATAVASDLGSSDFINNYTGIVIEVNGKGSVTINAQTIGNNKLAVKIGSADAKTYTQATKGDVTINYDVTENTYVYIYAVDADNQQQSLSMDITDTSDNAVKVYSVTVTPDATAIETVTEATIPTAVFGKVYSIDGKQFSQPQKGLNILKMSDGTTRKVVK